MTTHAVTSRYDPDRGNIPTLTGNKNLATIYPGHPDRDKEMPPIMKSQTKDLLNRTVVIQNEKGFYLHEDGRTMGDDCQFAIKFQLHADNVERQLRKVKEKYGVNWHWTDSSTLKNAIDC